MHAISMFWSFPFLSLCLVSQHLQSALPQLKKVRALSLPLRPSSSPHNLQRGDIVRPSPNSETFRDVLHLCLGENQRKCQKRNRDGWVGKQKDHNPNWIQNGHGKHRINAKCDTGHYSNHNIEVLGLTCSFSSVMFTASFGDCSPYFYILPQISTQLERSPSNILILT